MTIRLDRVADVPLFHTADEILAHPSFAASRRAWVEAILALYEDNPFMNRLLIEAGRSVIFFNILALHAAYEPSERATWPTLRRLQETVAPYGLSSTRRVHDVVARLIETGYVESHPAPLDRRAHILTPTDRMLAHDLDWLVAFYKPLDIMFPEPGYGPPMRRDPIYRKAHRAIGPELTTYAARLMSENPGVMLFMGREAGMMIMMKLIQSAEDGREGRGLRVSFADMAARFGVSRTHVRMILKDAEKAGLAELVGQSVALLPPLIAAFDRFLADTMAGHDLMFRWVRHGMDARSRG